MTEEELYDIERWVERVERNRRGRSLEREAQLRRAPMGLALQHLADLSAEVRRLWGEIDRMEVER